MGKIIGAIAVCSICKSSYKAKGNEISKEDNSSICYNCTERSQLVFSDLRKALNGLQERFPYRTKIKGDV